MDMNRRGFFGLLGKLAAVAVSAKIMPFKMPLARDVVTFDGPPIPNWYLPTFGGICNWSFSKPWKVSEKARAAWTDPKNWSSS